MTAPSILWVRPASNGALETMDAVAQTLTEGELGSGRVEPSLAVLRSEWNVDLSRRVKATRPAIGPLLDLWRGTVTRVLWWFHRPQWGQVSEFHRATLDLLEVLLAHQRSLDQRIARLERELSEARSGRSGSVGPNPENEREPGP